MGNASVLTDQLLVRFKKDGLSDREIAERFGLSRTIVGRHRRRLEVPSNRERRRFTDQELVNLCEKGLNDREVAERLGVSRTTVYTHRLRLERARSSHR